MSLREESPERVCGVLEVDRAQRGVPTAAGAAPPQRGGLVRAWAAVSHATRAAATRARLSRPGVLLAGVFFCLSLTPSLLPRTWDVQGLISGSSAAIGYGAGVSGRWLWVKVAPRRMRLGATVSWVLRPAVDTGAVVLVVFFMYQGSLWQRDLYALMVDDPPDRPSFLGVLVVSVPLVAGLILVARGLRFVARWLTGRLRRWIPALAARIVGVTVVVLLTVGLVDGVVVEGFLTVASATSETTDRTVQSSLSAPTAPTRSGSPQSLVSWESLGKQGRSFVAGGPTIEQLRQFGGPQAQEPIRVYVGLEAAPTIEAASALAVRELERTGAFSRSVLCVVITTGTGWVDPHLAAALEFLHNGDTAVVGTQYSYLPSWISFLTERERVERAGRELFNQVYARWAALPVDQRPRLVVFAESLGSLGAEAAFADLDDVRTRTDGMLLAGPTNANPLWREFVANRDPGTLEILPIFRDGTTVRFASTPADLRRPEGEWRTPRVVYLQNPSDPVTWWSPGLIFNRPDWLTEPAGYDVLPAMRWYPFVTFLQVTADLALAYNAPPAHGHDFDHAAVAAWLAIAPPAGWTDARTQELTQMLDEQM